MVAQCILDFFCQSAGGSHAGKALARGVKPQPFHKREGVFSGKNVVITGTLAGMGRSEAAELVRRHGGNIQSGVERARIFSSPGKRRVPSWKRPALWARLYFPQEEFLAMLEE